MQITVAPPHELGRDEIAAWRSMQHQTDYLASPFLSPEFTLAVGAFRPGARVNNCQGLSLVEGQRPFEPYAATMTPSPVIDLADGFDAYQEKLRVKSPGFCRDLTRKALRPEQEAGELRFVLDSRDPEALRGLIDWKSDQFLRNGTVNIFGRSWIVGLLDRLLSTRGDHLSVLLSVFYAGDTPVATRYCLRSGRLLAEWFCAYDARFGRRSPGLLEARRQVRRHPALFRAAGKLLQHYGRVALGNCGVPGRAYCCYLGSLFDYSQ